MLRRVPLTIVLFFFFILLSAGSPTEVGAGRYTSFSSCPHPTGTLTVHYGEGWHWIAGYPALQWGSDSVYASKNNNYVQCFCPKKPPTGENMCTGGIQTNWLKASTVDVETHPWLVDHGWLIVKNGSDFGLSSEKYFAKNIPFWCKSNDRTSIVQTNQTTIVTTVNSWNNSGNTSVSGAIGGNVTLNSGTIVNTIEVTTISGSNTTRK